MTFEQIQAEAAKLGHIKGTLGDRVDDILDRARINADDTVHLEKASTDYSGIAIATIQEILSYSSDVEAQEWFKSVGINF